MEASNLMAVQELRTVVQSLSTKVESQARELSEHRRVKQLDDEMIACLSKELQKVEDCNRLVVAKLLQRELEVSECREQLWVISQNTTRANHLSSFLMNSFDPHAGGYKSPSPSTSISDPLKEQLRSLLCERAELKSTVEDQRELMQQLQRDYVEYKEQAIALKDKVAALMVELEVVGRAASQVEGVSQMMQSHIMSLLNGFEETRSQLFQELRSHLTLTDDRYHQLPSEAYAPPSMSPNHHCDDLCGSVLLLPPAPSSPPLDGFDYDEFEQDSMGDGAPPPLSRRTNNRRGSSVDTTSESGRFQCPSDPSGALHFDNEFTLIDDLEIASWKSPMSATTSCYGTTPEADLSLSRKLFVSSASIGSSSTSTSSKTNPLYSGRRKSMMQCYNRLPPDRVVSEGGVDCCCRSTL